MNGQPKRIKTTATWTDDCQGKKDYDGELISVSTRYWPAKGGFWVVNKDSSGTTIRDGEDQKGMCSARSAIIVEHGDGYFPLVECQFEAPTQEAIQRCVEAWVEDKVNEVYQVLREHFGKGKDKK